MQDTYGRPYASVADIKTGDILEADGGFTCIPWVDTPESSNVKRYRASKLGLDVEFKSSPTIYRYLDVPNDIVEAFKAAESKGSFLARQIKPNFKVEKLP